MNQNKDFYVFKFLLPTSILMMIVGFFLMSPSASDVIKYLSVFSLVFGVVFFAVGIIDRSSYHKRNKNTIIKQQDASSDRKNSILIRLGWGIIIFIICYSIFLFIIVSNFRP